MGVKSSPEDSAAGAGDVVQLIRRLPGKNESLSSENRHPCKILGGGGNHMLGRRDKEDSQDSLGSHPKPARGLQVQWETLPQKPKERGIEEDT